MVYPGGLAVPVDPGRPSPPSTRRPAAPPPDLLAPHLPQEEAVPAQPAAPASKLSRETARNKKSSPSVEASAAVSLPAGAPLSAQCPACSLHALVPVHLRHDEKTGRWRQLGPKDELGPGVMTLDTCPVCFGVWLDQGEIDVLGDADIDPAFLKTLVGRSAGRMCPRGHGFMNEHVLPGMLKTPVDRCPRCRGLWLDGDERHALARSTTKEGQEDDKVRMAKRGLIWAAQVLTQLPIEVDNPQHGTPWAVYGLAAMLVAMYVMSVEGVVYARDFALVAGRVHVDPVHAYTVFTHAFFHADWFHLLCNLYFLYIFGDNVEYVYGRRRFLLLYFGAGLFGGVLQLLLTRALTVPVVGASGAIAGVCGAYLVIYPRARLLQTLPFIFVQVKIPAWVYLCVWLGFQAVMAFFSDAIQFAWFSHMGGFLFGAAITPLVLRSRVREVAGSVRVKSAAAIFGKIPRRRGPPIVVSKAGTASGTRPTASP